MAHVMGMRSEALPIETPVARWKIDAPTIEQVTSAAWARLVAPSALVSLSPIFCLPAQVYLHPRRLRKPVRVYRVAATNKQTTNQRNKHRHHQWCRRSIAAPYILI